MNLKNKSLQLHMVVYKLLMTELNFKLLIKYYIFLFEGSHQFFRINLNSINFKKTHYFHQELCELS